MIYRKPSISGKNLAFCACIAILASISIWSYFNLDQRVYLLLSQNPPKWHRNHLLAEFALLGKGWLPVWLLLIWSAVTGRKRPVLIGVIALVMVAVTVMPLKVCTRRARPHEVAVARARGEEQADLSAHLSFPSGDTAMVFAIATTTLPLVTWPVACLLLVACVGVALLRVTGMAHYPSDVFAGAAIGVLAGRIATQIDRRWPLMERLQCKLGRGAVILGIIIMPLCFGFSEGADELVAFVTTYGPLVLSACVLGRALTYFRMMTSPAEGSGFNRFDSVLRHLRGGRTLALRMAFLVMIAENIIDGNKPHELAIADGSAMASIGLALVLAGTAIRFWARGHFVKGRLFTTGPYGIIRHPLYLGSFFVVIGVLFQLSGWLNWIAILSVFTVTTLAAIVYEERSLERLFGRRWQLYKARTPALIPSLPRLLLPKEIGKWSCKVYLSTGELYASMMFLCLPFLIELMEDYVFEGMLGI